MDAGRDDRRLPDADMIRERREKRALDRVQSVFDMRARPIGTGLKDPGLRSGPRWLGRVVDGGSDDSEIGKRIAINRCGAIECCHDGQARIGDRGTGCIGQRYIVGGNQGCDLFGGHRDDRRVDRSLPIRHWPSWDPS